MSVKPAPRTKHPLFSGDSPGLFPYLDSFLGFQPSRIWKGDPHPAAPRPRPPPRRRRISMSDASGRGTTGGRDSPRHSHEWKRKKEEAAEEEARASTRGGERSSGASSRRSGGSGMPLGPRGQPRSAAGAAPDAPETQRAQSRSRTPRPAFPDHH